ncbi:MAG: hypothetical protein ACJAZO_002200 [Myxococcota bacterium]|jgi:hypothetical protein
MVLFAACTENGTDELLEPIEPGTETVSTSFNVNIYSNYESPRLASFDTLDGRRQLDGMTIRLDHAIDATVTLQNASDVDLAEGDFAMDHFFNTLVQLGEAPDAEQDDDLGTPFFGPGGFTIHVETALSPEGADGDSYESTVTEELNASFDYDPVETPRYLDAMTDKGDVLIVIGGFSETFFNFDPSLEGSGVVVDWTIPTLQYSGEFTVDYHYSPAE